MFSHDKRYDQCYVWEYGTSLCHQQQVTIVTLKAFPGASPGLDHLWSALFMYDLVCHTFYGENNVYGDLTLSSQPAHALLES